MMMAAVVVVDRRMHALFTRCYHSARSMTGTRQAFANFSAVVSTRSRLAPLQLVDSFEPPRTNTNERTNQHNCHRSICNRRSRLSNKILS